ncbi:MAG TPA: diguanylate cyclase [Terriglobales bacterium]|nr:diguanylate cyclase [Terriglobales bacterium]
MKDFQKTVKVLVADDSAVYRKLVENTLGSEEYSVILAKNGLEAVHLLTEHRPAIVITDWEMPDLSGLDLCRQIRPLGGTYTYIILLTSNNGKDQIVKGLAAGADDYLTKPFHAGELLARVGVGRRIVDLHEELDTKNSLLEELALTDSLTGLPNRRAVEQWSVRELGGAVRHGFPFWAVIADLDHFKAINDNHGHAAGDFVLKGFADVLRANTRASNVCGRLGGEEFVIAMGHVSKQNLETAIERIRRQVEGEQFVFNGAILRVTASFGISGFQGGEAPGFDDLLRDADSALYAAKRTGRNRIQFAC